MGMKYKEYGGGPATGLADDFIKFLSGGLSGTFGGGSSAAQAGNADPMGSTMGIGGILNDLLSGGAGEVGGALQSLISKDVERNSNAIRSRFGAQGGQAFGTPAAFAESLLRSESAPRLTQAIGGLQLGAVQSLLPIFAGLASKGITQRQGTMEENPWVTGFKIAAPLIQAGAGLAMGNPLAAAGGASGAVNAFSNSVQPLPGLTTSPDLFANTPAFSNFMLGR